MADPDQLIRERAYHLWLQEGCPDDRADFHWHVAREQVLALLRKPARKAQNRRAPTTPRATQRAARRLQAAAPEQI
jgi:Protein of unknown function (DUF2934)